MASTRTLLRRCRSRLRLEQLEDRLVLSGMDPTALDQLMLEQLNDIRANPAAYGATIGLGLSSVAPAQPLAWDPRLIAASQGHSQDMNDQNYFAHTSPSGVGPGDRITAQSYSWTSWGESIAAGYATTADALKGLIVDTGVSDLGHRKHLLAIDQIFKTQSQVGIGIVQNGAGTYSNYYTVDTAAPTNTRPFLTGAVINDANNNGKYDLGEGLAGVTITVQGVGSTTTFDSGGYQIQLSPGTYTVTASGGGLVSPITQVVTVGAQNQRLEFIQSASQATAANAQFVQNLYLTNLKRPASAAEVATYAGQLNAGLATPASLTAMVKASQEYKNVCTVWLHQAYKDVLGHDCGAAEVNNWLGWLQGSGSLDGVANALVTSTEYHQRQWAGWVQSAYQTFLHRAAGANEVAAWINNFQRGWTQDGFVSVVVNSGEYQGRFANNTQFVATLYTDMLGRNGAASEINGWTGMLQAGTSRSAVVAGFLSSFEYHWHQDAVWITLLYQACLGRPPDANESNVLTTALVNGTAFEAIDISVLGSLEYYRRAARNG